MISVEAALLAESAGMRTRIDGRANVLTCRIEGSAMKLLGTLRRTRQLLPLVRAVTPLLTRTGIRLEVVVGRFTLGRAGRGVEQNALARFLQLPAVHVGA